MAFVSITSTKNHLIATTGVYAGQNGPIGPIHKRLMFNKADIQLIRIPDDEAFVELRFRGIQNPLFLSYTTLAGTLRVDDVDGITPGDNAELQVLLEGIVNFTPPVYDSPDYEKSKVVKDSAGTLFNISGYSKRVTKQWIMIFDSDTLPSDGAVPLIVIPVDGQDSFYWDSRDYPKEFSTGIVVCNSTTGDTKTIGDDDCLFNVNYK